MRIVSVKFACVIWVALAILAADAASQVAQEETLSGPDSHETGEGPHGHLLGDWHGERSRLSERGVSFDFQYISDSLSNIKSQQPDQFASFNRFRGTVDIDLGTLIHQPGLYFLLAQIYGEQGDVADASVQIRQFLKFSDRRQDKDAAKKYMAELQSRQNTK